jgi:multiple sugar transport system permease protein
MANSLQFSGGRDRDGERSMAWRRQVLPGLILFGASSYFLLPLLWLCIASTKSTGDLFTSSGLWFAGELHLLDNLRNVMTHENGIFVRWMANSMLYSAGGAGIAALLSGMTGYAIEHYRFRGRDTVFALVLGAILIPSTALVLPLYLFMSSVGLTNTMWAVLLPSCVSPFGVYLARVFASANVPVDLIEAARIDGASDIKIFLRIALPLLTPSLVTIFLFQFVAIWNNFFLALVMLSDSHLYPVTLGLQAWSTVTAHGSTDTFDAGLVITGALVSIVPMIVGFVCLQRFWRSGLTSGAVKG